MEQTLGHEHSANGIFRSRTKRGALAKLGKGGRDVVGRNQMQRLAVPAVDGSELGVTEPNRILEHSGKDRLKITGRARDDLKHMDAAVCCSSASRSSLSSRAFSMAITAWAANVVTSSI